MKFIVLLTLVFIGSSAALGQAADSFQSSEVREILGKYDQAWNRQDVKIVDEILDDSYVTSPRPAHSPAENPVWNFSQNRITN